MKNHEITNNELELIFNHIVEQTPLITEDHVIVLLNNLPKAPGSNSFRHFLKTNLNAILISVAMLSVVSMAVFFSTDPESKTETAVTQSAIQENEPALLRENAAPGQPQPALPDSANKENTIKQATTNPEEVQTGPELLVGDVYKHFDKKPQVLSIRPNRDTVIVCKEGTAIRIKANSFVSKKTGGEITGIVRLAVNEYYKMSDILLAQLSTTSDGKIIETGGMLNISATSGNENCALKQGERLEIGFPCEKKKKDMILFSGAWKNDQINWTPVENPAPENSEAQATLMVSDEKPEEEVFVVVEELPEFPGGVTRLRQVIQENTHYPYSALKDKLEGKVYVNFVVDRSGSVRNFRIAKGLGNALDKAAVWAVSQMPAIWRPGRQRGLPVSASYTVPVTFRIKDSDLTTEGMSQAKLFEKQLAELKYDYASKKFIDVFEKKVTDGKLQESDIFAANRYVLSAYQLGWINCDRFVDFTNPKTNFSILPEEPRNTVISVIFNRFKAIARGQIENGRISFKDVPVGEKITIVALKTAKDKILLAVKEAVISDKMEVNLDFQPITIDLLKTEIKELNKLYLPE